MGNKDLLLCPWCGKAPEVCKAAGYGFTVECINETCVVGPSLNVTRGRANAIKAWNTRVDAELVGEVLFAVANGHKWTLEDWQNWRNNHARPVLTGNVS